MDKPSLSLCMIVNNEARHLRRCLTSVAGLVSEIIIADTGSTDGSMDIARSFGARVIDVPWEHDFAKARNITLRQAACPWILVLDADEAADGWRWEDLLQLLDNSAVQGYFLPFIHYVGSRAGEEYVTDNVCRLFRNDPGIVFHGTIHEEAASSIWALPGGRIAYADLSVLHYGYLDEELLLKNKASRNLDLIQSALQLDPQSFSLRYALGTEYYQQGEYASAADLLLPLLREAVPGHGYTADIYLKAAYALQSAGRSQDAKAVYSDGLAKFPDFTDLLESYARLLLEEGALAAAYRLLLEALRCGNTAHKYPSSSGSGTSRTSLLAGQVCERLHLYEEAKAHYTQAIRFSPDLTAAWAELAPLCLLSGDEPTLITATLSAGGVLSPGTLRLLVPAALNAQAAGWLQALAGAAQLPAAVRRLLQVLPELFRQQADLPAVAARLERLLPEHGAEQPFIHGYLWALACRAGDAAGAEQWLGSLSRCRPGLPAVARLLRAEITAQSAAVLPVAVITAEPAAVPPAEITVQSAAVPPAEITAEPAAVPPAEITVQSDAVPPAEITAQSDAVPPAEITVQSAAMPPAEITAQSAAVPPAEITAEPAAVPPAEITVQSAAVPPAEITAQSAAVPPAEITAQSAAVLPPAAAELAYAAQLLLQAGAWSSLLGLYRSAGLRLQWTRLPQPVLRGLLQAPAAAQEQWCSIYEEHHYGTPAGAAEWLLYAAIADSCGRLPRLEPAAEQALRRTGSKAVLTGLAYHKLQLAAGAAAEPLPAGSIPRLLLVRSALGGG